MVACDHPENMAEFELSKFTPAPQPELICGICMDVLKTPYETPCRHVFCRLCILRALRAKRKCPICRAPCTRKNCKDVVPIVQQLINKLTMRCNNFQNGCTELIPKERFLDHIKTCSYAMVQCRHKGCSQKLLEKDRENHEQSICPCRGGCGRPAVLENASPDKCTKAVVKNAKKKNIALKKRRTKPHLAPASNSKPDSSVAPRDNQNDDDNWNSDSIIHGDNTSDDFGDGNPVLSSHQHCTTNIAADDDGSQLVDLVQGNNYRQRSSKIAALSVRSDYVYSDGGIDYVCSDGSQEYVYSVYSGGDLDQSYTTGASESDNTDSENNGSPFAFRYACSDVAQKASALCDDLRRILFFARLIFFAWCFFVVMLPMMWYIL